MDGSAIEEVRGLNRLEVEMMNLLYRVSGLLGINVRYKDILRRH